MEPGLLIDGRFRVDAELASGGVGTVYRCTDVDLDRPCCLKVLKTPIPDNAEQMLRAEARALATIRHEHVVGVYGFGVHQRQPFFVMEFVEGRDLGWLIHEHYGLHASPIPLGRAVQLLRELCDGLAAVHGAGIVHRDIKPANVILESRTGRLVLADFGAAVVGRRWEGGTIGTPHYMSPEAFAGERPTVQSDLYSLGCLAFELLTGVVPYDAEDLEELGRMHRTARIPRISGYRPELEGFDPLFESLLAKDPKTRPTSAAMLGNQLDDRIPTAPRNSQEPPSEVISTALEGIRILVVDDDSTFARMAARCAQIALAETRISVKRIGTGAAAVDSALRKRPDLVILDYLLPDGTGVDVLSRIREHDGRHAEVVVASGALGAKDRWRFHILGVTDFVDKPIEFQNLVEIIHRIAARRAWIGA